MRYAEVKMTVIIPDDEATDTQILEWVSFSVNEGAGIRLTNPLSDYDIETEGGSVEIEVIQ